MSNKETCGVCGGDGRIITAHQSTSCPACRGSGYKSETVGFHDVTKTKPSHHEKRGPSGKVAKKTEPSTPAGRELAEAVTSAGLSGEATTRLRQSIMDYEDRKGSITKTFSRLIMKEVRALRS